MNLKDCFERAKCVLKDLTYPTGDAITPVEKALSPFINSMSDYFAINLFGYLESEGVFIKSDIGSYILNRESLENSNSDSYRSYLEKKVSQGGASHLRKLLEED